MIFDILDYRLLKDIALHVCLSGVPKNLLIFWERRKNEALQATKWLPVAEFLPTTGPPKAQHEVLGEAETSVAQTSAERSFFAIRLSNAWSNHVGNLSKYLAKNADIHY